MIVANRKTDMAQLSIAEPVSRTVVISGIGPPDPLYFGRAIQSNPERKGAARSYCNVE